MKKILYILCAFFALSSCQKENLPTTEGGQNPDGSYTFNLGIEEPDYAPQSRAAVTMGRYMLEMYEGDLTATPVKMTNTTGVFNVGMKKNTNYVCLFWADNGTSYTATDLKAVKLTDETAQGTAAYFAKVAVNSNSFNGAVTLKRAVAELSFIDKNGLTEVSNTLKITYPYASATLNVGDGTVTYAAGSAVRTIANIAPPADKTTAFATDFVLAPTTAGKLAGLKLQLNSEEEKTIAETAIQANYRTKITGEYQPKPAPAPAPAPVPLAVGDFYYSDKTYSKTYNGAKTCIGIVYVVNTDGKTGKIVGLTEPIANWNGLGFDAGILPWGGQFGAGATYATNEENGATNMATIKALDHTFADYPAFAWAESQNTPAIAGITWYIPAKEELSALYGTDGATKSLVNASLTTAGKTLLSNWYWSSTENFDDYAWDVYFVNGNTNTVSKYGTDNSVRVVSAF